MPLTVIPLWVSADNCCTDCYYMMCAISTDKVFFVVVDGIVDTYIVDTVYCHHFNRHHPDIVRSSSRTWSSWWFIMWFNWICSWCSRLLSDDGDYRVCIDCIIKINIHIHPIVSISLFGWWMNLTVNVVIVLNHIVSGNSLSFCYSYSCYSYWCWYCHIYCYCYYHCRIYCSYSCYCSLV